MVAIVSGAGLGLDRSSLKVFGDVGQAGGELGSASFGRFGENVFVNAANGNLMIDRTDEVLIGLGLDDVISRGYNSQSLNQGYKSHDGWQWGDERCITGLQGTLNQPGSSVTRIDADGSDTVFTWDATASAYICHQAGHAGERLTHGVSLWTWKNADSSVTETYDDLHSGRLVSVSDAYGHGVTYAYDLTSGLLTSASTSDGEVTTLTWSTSGTVPLLKKYVTTKADQTTLTCVRYTYDNANRLKTVTVDLTPGDNAITDGNTVVTTYAYDGTSDRVASITQTGGAEIDFTYQLVGSTYRVASFSQKTGATAFRTTNFTYNTNSTTMTDANGQTVLTFDSGGNGRLMSVQYPADHTGATTETYSYTYNNDGQLATVTDPLTHLTSYNYDGNDNLHIATDALGNTVTYGYDTSNHVVTATYAPGSGQNGTAMTVRYAYNSHGQLRFIVDGDNEVTEYQYDSSTGLRTAAITYRDSVFNLPGYGPTDVIPESALASWASGLADRSNLDRVDYAYDFRGNLSTETRYEECRVNTGNGIANGTNTLITYIYDQFGNLLSRNTSGLTNSEVYTYDGLNRLASSTDLANLTTSVLWNDAQNTCTMSVQGGVTRVSTYDVAGELVSTSQSAANMPTELITYKYDAMGRLAMTIDATMRTTYFLYDNLGRKTATIAGDGAITEYRYDAANRLVATIGYAGRLSQSQLNQLVDITGNPTNPPVASILPNPSADDVWTWNVYDSDNRLLETIARDGSATVLVYDNMSNVISTTSYYYKLNTTNFTTTFPTTVQTPQTHAEDDNTRIYYDNEGRVIGALDADGNLNQNVYDHAGNKIQTISFATQIGSTHRGDGFSSLVGQATTTGKDLQSRFYYDDRGLLRFALDATLRPTEYVYDTAGHLTKTIDYAASLLTTPATIDDMEAAASALAGNTNNRISWDYYDTASGRLIYTIQADGEVTSYLYDALGNIAQTTLFSLRYNGSNNNQSSVTNWVNAQTGVADNRVTRYAYDAVGRLVFAVDAENYVSENRYDADGRVTLSIRYATRYATGGLITQGGMNTWAGATIPSTAVQTGFSYDTDGRLSDTIEDLGGLAIDTHTVYDALGRVSDVTAAFGSDPSTTHYVYDTAGRVLSETHAFGEDEAAVTSYTYNGEGRVLTSIDPNNNTTKYDYDAAGNLVKQTDALNNITTHTYDAFGNKRTSTDPLNNVSYFYYDKLGQLIGQVDQERYVTVTSYTIGGAVASVTRYANAIPLTVTIGLDQIPSPTPSDHDATTLFERDKLDRLTKVTDAEGFYERYQLDAFGDRIYVWAKSASGTVQQGGMTTNTYDHRGLLLSETLPVTAYDSDGNPKAPPVMNTYTYDSRGNLATKVEADGLPEERTTVYTYDKLDRLTKVEGDAIQVMNDADFGTTSNFVPTTFYTYDKRGNLIETKDPDNARTLFYYDALNRKTAEVNALGTLSAWTYDDNGNVKSSRVYGNYVALPQNPGGDPPAPIDPNNYRETTYSYDTINRLTGTAVAGLITGVYSGSSYTTTTPVTLTTGIHYNKAINSTRQIDGIGNSTWTYYDKLGRVVAQVDQDKFVTLYELDDDGNVTKETRYAAATTLVLGDTKSLDDIKGSLNNTDPKNRVTIFTYDRNGHRLTEERQNVDYYTIDSDPASQTFGAITSANGVSKVSYTYNGLGEVLTKTEATLDKTTYTYDAGGRQIAIDLSNVTSGGVTMRSHTIESYDGLNNLVFTDQYDALASSPEHRATHYTYGAGGRLVSVKDAENFVRSFAYDKAGRVRLVSYDRTHSNGTTKTTEGQFTQYDLLGRITSQGTATGPTWTKYESTGAQYDVFGEVSAQLVNDVVQKKFEYDNGGRLWRSTDEGVVTIYLYDKAGHQTLSVTTDGVALPNGKIWSTMSLSDAITLMTDPVTQTIGGAAQGMVETITTYDARGQQLSTRLPQRQLSDNYYLTDTEDLVLSRTYDAFGEVLTEKDAKLHTTTYVYNNLGKITQQILPQINTYNEQNQLATVSPTQTNYYDISGRLIGVADADGTIGGYVNTQVLLANTGYDGSDALVVGERHADGGKTLNTYDVFGDALSSQNEIGDTTTYLYDKLGRVKQVTHPLNQDGVHRLIDYYTYDELGQRLTHWNSLYTQTYLDKTDYDAAGRVSQTVDMEGHTITYGYLWHSNLSTTGLGQFGGWTKTTTMVGSGEEVPETESTDAGGRTIAKTDFGDNDFTYTYDMAGRLSVRTSSFIPAGSMAGATPEEVDFAYYNTGLVKMIDSFYATEPMPFLVEGHLVADYSYDKNGNEIFEDERRRVRTNFGQGDSWLQSLTEWETATYNSENWMVSFQDKAPDNAGDLFDFVLISDPVTTNFKYDANGNIRNRKSTYEKFDENSAYLPLTTEDDWYIYDRMNRFTLTKGQLISGLAQAGTTGTVITYNAAGQRVKAVTANETDDYSYSDDGYLTQAKITTSAGIQYAYYTNDVMGRVTFYDERNTSGVSIYSKDTHFNHISQVTQDTVYAVRPSDGTYTWTTTYDYLEQGTSGYNGVYDGGTVTHSHTTTTKTGTGSLPTTDAVYSFIWFDSAQEAGEVYTPDTSKSDTYTSTLTYDQRRILSYADIHDGYHRDIGFNTNIDGQVTVRSETTQQGLDGAPRSLFYYFGGVQMGDISNDGTSNVDYVTSIQRHTAKPGNSLFNNGGDADPVGDFDQSYQAINGLTYGQSPSSYTVQGGDTLQAIAQAVWGDSSFWYLIAEANGLDSTSTLEAGMSLIIPNKVANAHNNTSTYNVYDPNEHIGNISPTHPPKPQPHHNSGCGILGQILLAVIAVVVSVVSYGTMTGFAAGFLGLTGGAVGVVGGALAAVAGSLVSQGIGLATGLQKSFDWAGLGMAAIGGAVGGALGVDGFFGDGAGAGAFSSLEGDIGSFGVGALRGVTQSLVTQGLGVATGLQKSFNWAGVAAAGVGGGVLNAMQVNLSSQNGGPISNPHVLTFVSGLAGDIASAATLSLITGSDFGGNILQGLPSVIGSTVGNAIVDKMKEAERQKVWNAVFGDDNGGSDSMGRVAGGEDSPLEVGMHGPAPKERAPSADRLIEKFDEGMEKLGASRNENGSYTYNGDIYSFDPKYNFALVATVDGRRTVLKSIEYEKFTDFDNAVNHPPAITAADLPEGATDPVWTSVPGKTESDSTYTTIYANAIFIGGANSFVMEKYYDGNLQPQDQKIRQDEMLEFVVEHEYYHHATWTASGHLRGGDELAANTFAFHELQALNANAVPSSMYDMPLPSSIASTFQVIMPKPVAPVPPDPDPRPR